MERGGRKTNKIIGKQLLCRIIKNSGTLWSPLNKLCVNTKKKIKIIPKYLNNLTINKE